MTLAPLRVTSRRLVHREPAQPDELRQAQADDEAERDVVERQAGAGGEEHGEGVGILTCIDATRTGDITKSGKVWSYDKIRRSISTVSITPDGLLFIGDFSGYLHCFDAETGQLYWRHDLKSHIWGSSLVADGKVFIGDEDGDLAVFAASKEKKLLSLTNLGAPVYSTYGRDDEFYLHPGSFDETGLFAPNYELWTIRREPWLPEFPSVVTRYERNRPKWKRTEP